MFDANCNYRKTGNALFFLEDCFKYGESVSIDKNDLKIFKSKTSVFGNYKMT